MEAFLLLKFAGSGSSLWIVQNTILNLKKDTTPLRCYTENIFPKQNNRVSFASSQKLIHKPIFVSYVLKQFYEDM